MKNYRFDEMDVEQLWRIHSQITRTLTIRCEQQKLQVERQLAELGRRFGGAPTDLPKARPYPPVRPKYRNPALPAETWSGRGKQPKWVVAWLAAGNSLDDCRIQ